MQREELASARGMKDSMYVVSLGSTGSSCLMVSVFSKIFLWIITVFRANA